MSHAASIVSIVLSLGLSAFLAAGESASVAVEGKQPRVAVVDKDHVAIAYASADTIMVAMSSDGGITFGKPGEVAAIPKLMAGMRRGPQIAATATSIVVAGIGAAGDVEAWRSQDLGGKWLGAATVNDQPKAAREGLFSIAAGAKDSFWAVWLDCRENKTTVTASRSADGGKTWAANAAIYKAPAGSVCECCQPTVSADASGAIAVMWRNQVAGDRDLWLCSSANGGKSFAPAAKLGAGSWKLNACPMDGGGVAVSGAAIESVWRRDNDLFACVPAQPETALGSGRNATVAISGKKVYRAWQRGDAVCLAIDKGEPKDIGPGTYPHLAASSAVDGPVVLVWEAAGGVRSLRVDR
jgi:hypothetical protein